MSLSVDRGAPICNFVPERIGDKLVLRLAGPVTMAALAPTMGSLDLLQEQDVGGQSVQLLLQIVNHHPAGEMREALVNVVGRDREAHGNDRPGMSGPP